MEDPRYWDRTQWTEPLLGMSAERAAVCMQLLQTIKDAKALGEQNWRYFEPGGTQSKRNLTPKRRTLRKAFLNLTHWIHAPRFEWYCLVIELDPDRFREIVRDLMEGKRVAEINKLLKVWGAHTGTFYRWEKQRAEHERIATEETAQTNSFLVFQGGILDLTTGKIRLSKSAATKRSGQNSQKSSTLSRAAR